MKNSNTAIRSVKSVISYPPNRWFHVPAERAARGNVEFSCSTGLARAYVRRDLEKRERQEVVHDHTEESGHDSDHIKQHVQDLLSGADESA